MSLERKAPISWITMHCLPKILHGMHQTQGYNIHHRTVSRFSEARVNWAENMLQCRSESKIAFIEASSVISPLNVASINLDPFTVEPTPDHSLQLRNVTYAQLYHIVRDLVSALLFHGLRPGDRVASYSSNCIVSLFLGANVFMSATRKTVSLGKRSCMFSHYRYRRHLGQCSS